MNQFNDIELNEIKIKSSSKIPKILYTNESKISRMNSQPVTHQVKLYSNNETPCNRSRTFSGNQNNSTMINKKRTREDALVVESTQNVITPRSVNISIKSMKSNHKSLITPNTLKANRINLIESIESATIHANGDTTQPSKLHILAQSFSKNFKMREFLLVILSGAAIFAIFYFYHNGSIQFDWNLIKHMLVPIGSFLATFMLHMLYHKRKLEIQKKSELAKNFVNELRSIITDGIQCNNEGMVDDNVFHETADDEEKIPIEIEQDAFIEMHCDKTNIELDYFKREVLPFVKNFLMEDGEIQESTKYYDGDIKPIWRLNK